MIPIRIKCYDCHSHHLHHHHHLHLLQSLSFPPYSDLSNRWWLGRRQSRTRPLQVWTKVALISTKLQRNRANVEDLRSGSSFGGATQHQFQTEIRSKLSLQQLGPKLYRKWTFQAASQIYILLVQIMIQPAWMLKWWRRSDREATGFVQLYKGGLTGETRRGDVMYLDFLSFHCLIKQILKIDICHRDHSVASILARRASMGYDEDEDE